MNRALLRLPLFDKTNTVFAYRFSVGENIWQVINAGENAADGWRAVAAKVLGETTGQRLLMEVSAGQLLSEENLHLPAFKFNLWLPELESASEELVAACKALKDRGFQLTMGGYLIESGFELLAEIADFIAVDATGGTANHQRMGPHWGKQ